MKKQILVFCVIIIANIFTFAQNQSDEYQKAEFFAGYSNENIIRKERGDVNGPFINKDHLNTNGFNVSGVFNFSRFVGVKADFSGAYANSNDSILILPSNQTITFRSNNSLYNVLGGIQIKDNASSSRVKPFGYALIGAGHARSKVKNITCLPTITNCQSLVTNRIETGFASAFGGGLDIKINDRLDFRIIKIDYNPIIFNSGYQHNVRIGIGFVFK